MKAYELFKCNFKTLYLQKIYFVNVKYKSSVGNDKINHRLFEKNIDLYLNNIEKKVKNKTYKFTPYKQKLILKGKVKAPREVSMCTIRDKITLVALKELIFEVYKDEITNNLVKVYISKIQKIINEDKYNHVIKLDLKNYYGTIDHEILFKVLKKKIRKKEILSLIGKAITTGTTSMGIKSSKKNKRGIPQGLPISNVISSVYLKDFDRKHKQQSKYEYFRYVDDILIFCESRNSEEIKASISKELSKAYKLEVHDFNQNKDKCFSGDLKEGFSYLGYEYKEGKFTVRESTVENLEKRLEKLINDYKLKKYNSFEDFMYKFNFKVTGFINEDGEKYGWLFFFSQLEDIELLFKLDKLVEKLFKRNNIEISQRRKFSRAYHEMTYNLKNTNYVPKFKGYTLEDKRKILSSRLGKEEVKLFNDERVIHEFKKYGNFLKKDIEKDIQTFS